MLPQFDCVIVGAGPAGLSAALILGRCRRGVLVVDSGRPRNARSKALHGFLTRDGTPPAELLAIGREQLRAYPSVQLQSGTVVAAECRDGGFIVDVQYGERVWTRKLMLATGVVDELPPLEGIEQYYGTTVLHCPYCDGWEHRDAAIAIYGNGKSGASLALGLTVWSRDLLLCTDGPANVSRRDRTALARQRVAIREDRIARLEGTGDRLQRIVFTAGPPADRQALFVIMPQRQHSDLAHHLGCEIDRKRSVNTGKYEDTNVPGLYAVGDTSRDVQLVIVAAAEGAKAAFAVNKALLEEDGKTPGKGPLAIPAEAAPR